MMEVTLSSVITYLFSAYNQETKKRRMQIYYDALKDLPPEVLYKVVQKLVYSEKDMPAIATIIEATTSLMVSAGTVEGIKTWGEAWGEILNTMQKVSYLETPKFSTPEIEATVRAYGWMNLVSIESKDLNTARAQCRGIYEDFCRRSREERVNRAVLNDGKLFLSNRSRGEEIKRLGSTKGFDSVGSIMRGVVNN